MKLLFTGDFAPVTPRLKTLIEKEQYEPIFNGFQEYIKAHDISVTNLECPIGDSGHPISKVGPHLRAPLNTAKVLSWAGFNLVTLANNHIMDYGAAGLITSMEACENNQIATVGAGENLLSAKKPFYCEKNGVKVAILNVCEHEFSIAKLESAGANPIDIIDNYDQILEAKRNATHVLLVIHGGHEYYNLPSPKVQKLYRHYINLGVDVVIGHHPHCHSGYEEYNGGLIFYSLGNFVFDREVAKPPMWYRGYALSLTITDDKIGYYLIPYIQNQDSVGVHLLHTRLESDFKSEIDELNRIIADEKQLMNSWNDFVAGKLDKYRYRVLPTTNRYVVAFFNKFNLPVPFSKKAKLRLLNSIRCMSHNDIFVRSLEKLIEK